MLLLNTALTVRAHEANSHARKGWESFTDAAIAALSRKQKCALFLCQLFINIALKQLCRSNLMSWLTCMEGFMVNEGLLGIPVALQSTKKRPRNMFRDKRSKVKSTKWILPSRGLVFLLWGKNAEQKKKLIDGQKHHILTAAHPSGLSANKVHYRHQSW